MPENTEVKEFFRKKITPCLFVNKVIKNLVAKWRVSTPKL